MIHYVAVTTVFSVNTPYDEQDITRAVEAARRVHLKPENDKWDMGFRINEIHQCRKVISFKSPGSAIASSFSNQITDVLRHRLAPWRDSKDHRNIPVGWGEGGILVATSSHTWNGKLDYCASSEDNLISPQQLALELESKASEVAQGQSWVFLGLPTVEFLVESDKLMLVAWGEICLGPKP